MRFWCLQSDFIWRQKPFHTVLDYRVCTCVCVRVCCVTSGTHSAEKNPQKNALGFPSHELADHCKCIMPASKGHTKVTDRAGPAGPEPDQLYIIPVCTSKPDEMQADGRRCEKRQPETSWSVSVILWTVLS